MAEWTFYDFDKNWDAFYKVWKTDEVQTILKKDMDNWCINEAFYEHKADGTMVKPTWSKGEPLWHLSRTDYHDIQISKRADEHIEKDRMVYHYKKTMENIFQTKYTKMLEDDLYEEFSLICYEKIYEECSPKLHTIDSLILFMGRNFISHALLACAEKLFPNNDVVFYSGKSKNPNDEIYICEQKIVFDLLNFYYVTRNNYKIIPKPKYIPGMWDNESEISIEFSDDENSITSTNSDFEYDSE